MSRRIVVLTEGYSNPHTGKTGANVIRYLPGQVVAVLDSTQAGKTSQELLEAGGNTPVVASLAAAGAADTLLIGIAPPGGKIPVPWRPILFEAIRRRMNIVSGLHDFLSDDPELVAAAKEAGVKLHDVRKNKEKDIARRIGLREDTLRVHTVGHDCSIGKMVVSVEVTRELQRRGKTAKFIATGQTGIMIEGDGAPIDCVVADFVSGATEKMILAHQKKHEFLLIEGQGSLVHPSYSGVTLGLLHGCFPQALILCYEVGRTSVTGLDHVPIPPLAEIKRLNEIMASIHRPVPVIGVGMNSRKISPAQAEDERKRVRDELGVPVCDVFRHGAGDLVDAVIKYQAERVRVYS